MQPRLICICGPNGAGKSTYTRTVATMENLLVIDPDKLAAIDPLKYDLIFSRFLVPERCGLSWKDELTVLAPDITLGKGERLQLS